MLDCPGAGVQHPVSQCLRFRGREFTMHQQQTGPREEVACNRDNHRRYECQNSERCTRTAIMVFAKTSKSAETDALSDAKYQLVPWTRHRSPWRRNHLAHRKRYDPHARRQSRSDDALSATLTSNNTVHDCGRVLTDLAVTIADGGTSISDIEVLGNQKRIFGDVASTSTAWRTLDEIDVSKLVQITADLNQVRAKAWALISGSH